MFNLKIITVGKIKEKWLVMALSEYQKRLSNTLEINWILLKNDEQLAPFCAKEKFYVCLDRNGTALSSEEFSTTLFRLLEKNKHELSIVIGGALGLDKETKARAQMNLSLSQFTFTHQLTRLILIEQVYRAFEIAKNSPYHK
jgi:23S rRNA (pseudouridine1915-N3)-methyltransferase